MAGLCDICAALQLQRFHFTSPAFDPEGRYRSTVRDGSISALRDTCSSCPLCALIANALERGASKTIDEFQDDQSWSLKWLQNTFDYEPNGDVEEAEDLYGAALYASFDADETDGDYGIQLIDHEDTEEFLRGRFIHQDVSVKRVAGWLDRCRRTHGESCSSRLLRRRDLVDTVKEPLICIDVHRVCLSPLPPGAQYAALSYVWGRTNSPMTLFDNVSTFSQPNGLAVKLPKTISDAINFTRALGLKYLWVDSLCIVQDDLAHKRRLIESMDAIYSNCLVCLVAATGTEADSGLSGLSNKHGRDLRCIDLAEDLCLGILPYYQRELLNCDHAKRAWTYQETCLSPRCIVFLNGYVYFNCNSAVYAEYIHAEVDGITPETSANTLGKTESAISRLHSFSRHLNSYTERHLTYEADGLNAFQGILNALSPSMGVKDCFQGIPPSCFDNIIMWNGYESLVRRRGFPSWSWVGWTGRIQAPPSTSNVYDQQWLLKGTWINWYRVDERGSCFALWDSRKPEFMISEAAKDALQRSLIEHSQNSAPAPFQTKPSQALHHISDAESDNESDSNEEDEDLQDEFCPTYGPSTSENPFGRIMVAPSIQHFYRPPIRSHMRLRLGSFDHSNLICFDAFLIPLSVMNPSRSHAGRDSRTILRLEDQHGCLCGFVFSHDDESWTDNSLYSSELIVTSLTTFGDLFQHHAEGYTTEIYQSQGAEDNLSNCLEITPEDVVDHHDYVNVILVSKLEQHIQADCDDSRLGIPVYERAGIGFVYGNALQEIDLTGKTIVMT